MEGCKMHPHHFICCTFHFSSYFQIFAGFSESNMASSSRMQNMVPRPGFSALHRLRKKRKGQRVKDPLDDLLLKTLMSQRAMEERFLQMEERRFQRDLDVEERRMQLEQRRFELEREHEYRMFNVFAQMLSILKQSHSGSSSSIAMPRGLDFNQALSEMTGLGGGGDLQELRARSQAERSVDMHGFCHPGDFQRSPYLSARGNVVNIFRGSTEEGYKAYHADKYDEDKNPNVSASLRLFSWLTQTWWAKLFVLGREIKSNYAHHSHVKGERCVQHRFACPGFPVGSQPVAVADLQRRKKPAGTRCSSFLSHHPLRTVTNSCW